MKNTNKLISYTKNFAVLSLAIAMGVFGFASNAEGFGTYDGAGTFTLDGGVDFGGSILDSGNSGGGFDSGFGIHDGYGNFQLNDGYAGVWGDDGMLFTGDEPGWTGDWGNGLEAASYGYADASSWSGAWGEDGLLFTGDEIGWSGEWGVEAWEAGFYDASPWENAWGDDGMLLTGDEYNFDPSWYGSATEAGAAGFYDASPWENAWGDDGMLLTGDEYNFDPSWYGSATEAGAAGFYDASPWENAWGDDGMLFTGDESGWDGSWIEDPYERAQAGFVDASDYMIAFGEDGRLFTGDEVGFDGSWIEDPYERSAAGFIDFDYEWEGFGYPSADGGYYPIQDDYYGDIVTLSRDDIRPDNDPVCSDGTCGINRQTTQQSRPTCTGCTGNSGGRSYGGSSRGSGLAFGNIVSDLLDLGLNYTSVRSDNDTNINVDNNSKTTYNVKNVDNSDRSVRIDNSYTDNSIVDNSIRIDSDDDTTITYNVDGDGGNGGSGGRLRVTCRVDDRTIDEGDIVRFEADITGGDSPFDYDWRGDIDGNDRVERVRFNRDGRYEVSVRVEDDNGRVATDSCPDIIVGDNNGGINLIGSTGGNNNAPDGNLASLNSVFLSQVPYTGAKDVLVMAGYIAAILVWSALIVFFIARARRRNKVSRSIESFKAQNREAHIIA